MSDQITTPAETGNRAVGHVRFITTRLLKWWSISAARTENAIKTTQQNMKSEELKLITSALLHYRAASKSARIRGGPDRRSAAMLLTRDEARRITANFCEAAELLQKPTGLQPEGTAPNSADAGSNMQHKIYVDAVHKAILALARDEVI